MEFWRDFSSLRRRRWCNAALSETHACRQSVQQCCRICRNYLSTIWQEWSHIVPHRVGTSFLSPPLLFFHIYSFLACYWSYFFFSFYFLTFINSIWISVNCHIFQPLEFNHRWANSQLDELIFMFIIHDTQYFYRHPQNYRYIQHLCRFSMIYIIHVILYCILFPVSIIQGLYAVHNSQFISSIDDTQYLHLCFVSMIRNLYSWFTSLIYCIVDHIIPNFH